LLSSDRKIIPAAELWRDAVGEGAEKPNPALVGALEADKCDWRLGVFCPEGTI
jgi:hypothetical protein